VLPPGAACAYIGSEREKSYAKSWAGSLLPLSAGLAVPASGLDATLL